MHMILCRGEQDAMHQRPQPQQRTSGGSVLQKLLFFLLIFAFIISQYVQYMQQKVSRTMVAGRRFFNARARAGCHGPNTSTAAVIEPFCQI
jgi:hypothetical protein